MTQSSPFQDRRVVRATLMISSSILALSHLDCFFFLLIKVSVSALCILFADGLLE